MTLDKLESQVIALNGGGNPSGAVNTNGILDHHSNNNHLEEQNCLLEGSRGVNYRGSQSITRNGLNCQKWNPQIMRSNYMNMASEEILNELSGHNYCRNIDNDIDGLWCYTTNPRMPKDYCSIPSCDSINNNELIKTPSQPTLDKSFMKESRLIIGVSVSFLVVIVFILIMFCMCRSRGNSIPTGTASNQHLIMNKKNEKQQQSITSSVNGMPILSNMSGGTCASSGASQIHPSRLRMSNVSLGNKKQSSLNKNHRGGSSKSSVASSSTNNNNQQQQNIINMEVNNPFIKNSNYDNQQNMFNYQQQQMQIHHQVPQFQIQQIQQQQMQQQFQQQHHHQQLLQQQQAPQAINDCDFSVKQFSANNLRLLQEIGKGNV